MPPPETPAALVADAPALSGRVVAALRHPGNWLQLVQFAVVGCSGFVVNTVIYWTLLRKVHLHYLPSAALAFSVAVLNNFLWNRGWTFRHARDAHAAFQAARFFVVSFAAFAVSAGVLTLLVEGEHVGKVVAQLIAVGLVMPFSFLANKLWSFRDARRRAVR